MLAANLGRATLLALVAAVAALDVADIWLLCDVPAGGLGKPPGALLGALVADAFGLPTLFVVAAIVSMTPLLLMPILSNEAMDEAERETE